RDADLAPRRRARDSRRAVHHRPVHQRIAAGRNPARRAHPQAVPNRALGLLQGVPQARRVRRRAAPRAGAGGRLMRVALTVNGSAVTADVEPRVHLADFLRDHLLLTGTRLGCEHGVCGACTLLLDDEPVRACITLAAECDGRPVRTIEGLDDDPLAESLRAAFTAEHALQCGYCTPGMIVTARDIVRRLPGADEDRIRLE